MNHDEYLDLETRLRTLRRRALESPYKAEMIADFAGLAIPDGGSPLQRTVLTRMLNETVAIIGGAQFRPWRPGDEIVTGQLVKLPRAAWSHIGEEVDGGVYEATVTAPDDEGDVAIAEISETTYSIIEPDSIVSAKVKKYWVDVRLVEVLEDPDDADDENTEGTTVPAEKPALKRFATLTMPYPVSVGDLTAFLDRVEPNWQVWVTSSDAEKVEFTFAHPDSMKGE